MRNLWWVVLCLSTPSLSCAQTGKAPVSGLSKSEHDSRTSQRFDVPSLGAVLQWRLEPDRTTSARPDTRTWTLHADLKADDTVLASIPVRHGLTHQRFEAMWLDGYTGYAVVLRSKRTKNTSRSAHSMPPPNLAFILVVDTSTAQGKPRLERVWSGNAQELDTYTLSFATDDSCGVHSSPRGCLIFHRDIPSPDRWVSDRWVMPIEWVNSKPKTTVNITTPPPVRTLTPKERNVITALTSVPHPTASTATLASHEALALTRDGTFILLRHYDTTTPQGDSVQGRVELAVVSGDVIDSTQVFKRYGPLDDNGGGIDEVSTHLAWVPGAPGRLVQATVRVAASEFGGTTDKVFTGYYSVHCPPSDSSPCRLESRLPLTYNQWTSEGCMHGTDGGCIFDMGICRRRYEVTARVLSPTECTQRRPALGTTACVYVQANTQALFEPSERTFYVESEDAAPDTQSTEKKAPNMDAYFAECQRQLGAESCHAHWHHTHSECRHRMTTWIVPLPTP